MAEPSDNTAVDRRDAIADAAIEIIAREGLRALTHRAVDRRLGLADGSTSYYVRTRQQLLELVVRRLASRTNADLSASRPASSQAPSVEGVAESIARLIERIASRSDDQLARFALAVDLRSEPELHAFITSASPIREQLLQRARAIVAGLGAVDVEQSALGLLVVIDGLLFDRLAGSGRVEASRANASAVVAAYLQGLRGVVP